MASRVIQKQQIGIRAMLAAIAAVALWLGLAITVERHLDEVRRIRAAADAAKAEPLTR